MHTSYEPPSTGINGQAADDSAGGAGAAYLFTWDGGSWMQEAFIKASGTAAGDRFGSTVALSADGNVLAVGAANEDGGKSESGAACLY
ncbi:MAG TPA: hypothetical protein ENJ01_11115 [Gammaproteobacteria bacterium]|nr:hypothetical protein [Gammaproteobacteria bacterium]